MDKFFKQLWLDALESGCYKPGKYTLKNHSKNSYCCLGVALDIMCPIWRPDGVRNHLVNNLTGQLDHELCYAMNLPYEEMIELSEINDNSKNGFQSVIQHIKKYL